MSDAEDRYFGIPHMTIRGKIIVFTRDQDGVWGLPGRIQKHKLRIENEDEDVDKATDPMDIKRICQSLTRPMSKTALASKAGMSQPNVNRLIPRMLRKGVIRKVKGEISRSDGFIQTYTAYELT